MFNKKRRNEWENVYLKDYNIHYSRIIASWLNAGGKTFDEYFKNWLRSTGALTEDQIIDIYNLATNGKMEWEGDARRFLAEN